MVVVALDIFEHARLVCVLRRWSRTGRTDGLDLSRCQYKVVRADGLHAMNIHELRSCIRREFVMKTIWTTFTLTATVGSPETRGTRYSAAETSCTHR